MTDKEKIKSEFEKRSILCKKARIDLRKDINIAYYEGKETAYKEAVLYIDSLQEESVSGNLEEAAFDYAESCKYKGGDKLLCIEHFKAGAEWGRNQAMAEIQAQSMALAHGCPKEPVNEDLEEAAIRASMLKHDIPKEHLHEYLYNDYGMRKFVEGAKWQEEKDNETVLNNLIYALANDRIGNDRDEYVDWLKSLKERYTWKPSDEQIKVCKEVYADILSAKGFDLGTVIGELNRLEEELKKLKGE